MNMRKSGLSRRLFLGGAACAVTLPFFTTISEEDMGYVAEALASAEKSL